MSACGACLHLSFHILVEKARATYVDECAYYPDMVGKIEHKWECPHYIDRFAKDDDESIISDGPI